MIQTHLVPDLHERCVRNEQATYKSLGENLWETYRQIEFSHESIAI